MAADWLEALISSRERGRASCSAHQQVSRIYMVKIESSRQGAAGREPARLFAGVVKSLNHYIGRLDESGSGVAFFQLQLAGCIRRNDGCDARVADCENNLSHETSESYAHDFAG